MSSLPSTIFIVTLTVTTLAPVTAYNLDLTSLAATGLGTAAYITSQPALQTLGLALVKYGTSRLALEETLHTPYAAYEAHKFNVARLDVITSLPTVAVQALVPTMGLSTLQSYVGSYFPQGLNLQTAMIQTAEFLVAPSLDQTMVDQALDGTVTVAQIIANQVPEASDLPSYISDWSSKAKNAVDSNWNVVGHAINDVLGAFRSSPLGVALATLGWTVLQVLAPKSLLDLVIQGYLYPTPLYDAYELVTGFNDLGAGITALQTGLRIRSDPEGVIEDTVTDIAEAVYEEITGNASLDSVLEQCEILTPGDVQDLKAEGEQKFVEDAKTYVENAIQDFNLGPEIDQYLPYLGTVVAVIGVLRAVQGLLEIIDAGVSLGYLVEGFGASLPLPAKEEVEAALPALESVYSPFPLPPTP